MLGLTLSLRVEEKVYQSLTIYHAVIDLIFCEDSLYLVVHSVGELIWNSEISVICH